MSIRTRAEYIPQDDKIAIVTEQTNQVKDVLHNNINKLMGREKDLTELQRKTEDLEANAVQFQSTGVKTKKKFWWKNLKWKIILIAVILILLIIIGLAIGLGVGLTTNTINSTANSG
jgi:hypothetical protein